MVGEPSHVKQLSLNHVCKIGLKGILQSESPKGERGGIRTEYCRLYTPLQTTTHKRIKVIVFTPPLWNVCFLVHLGDITTALRNEKEGRNPKPAPKKFWRYCQLELIIIPLSTIFKTTTTRGRRKGGLFLFILTVLWIQNGHFKSWIHFRLFGTGMTWIHVLDQYPNQTFSKLPQQKCSFIFSPFLLDSCKIW